MEKDRVLTPKDDTATNAIDTTKSQANGLESYEDPLK
jgi:hypothetical protein